MKSTKNTIKIHPPGRTPEAEENNLIAMANDLAKKQLANGTASAQVITHYLKQGSMRERLERENLKKDLELKAAKIEAIKSGAIVEELYREAIIAMRTYSGQESNGTTD